MSLRNHNWREVLKVLTRFGYVLDRQRGSHMILKNSSGNIVPVPRHDPIKPTTLKSILDQAGISLEQFLKEV